MTEAKDDGGEGLYVRGRSGQRDMKYNHKKSQSFFRNEDHVLELMGMTVLMYVPELRRNLILLGTLEDAVRKDQGFYHEDAVRKDQGYKGFASEIYQQNGLVEKTNVTLLAKVHCFLIQSGLSKVLWAEDTTMSTYLVNKVVLYRNMGFNESKEYKKTFIDSGVGTGAVQVLQGVEFEKTGLKEERDARSDVYVLNKCTATVTRNVVTTAMAITRSLHQPKGNILVEGQSILSLEGSLSGDYDVEKNGKWSCIYAVGSQEYQVVCTRLDIASADVGMFDKFDRGLQIDVHVFVDFDYTIERSITVMAGYMTLTEAVNEAIGLKGLSIKSRFELKIVAGIAIGSLSKAIPGLRFQHRLNLLSICIG
ncbi:hypothetical protein Tco_0580714 [Tanacetum coccineum]